MKEIQGDLFDQRHDALCITTNGFVKQNGEAVMGKGCAAQAAKKMPWLPEQLGNSIRELGNNVTHLVTVAYTDEDGMTQDWLSFPVKPHSVRYEKPAQVVKHMRKHMRPGQLVPGWACVADLDIIVISAKQLVERADFEGYRSVVIPRPGCGAGELSWDIVRPVLNDILDDRFHIITY